MLKGIRLAAWLAMLGSVVVSAARVVIALEAQAFDRVASAGLPAIIGLAGGVLVLAVTHAIQDARTTRNLLKNLLPTQPASVIGLVLLLGGSGWVAYVYWSLDATVRAWAVIPAALGAFVAMVGILMLVAAGRSPKR